MGIIVRHLASGLSDASLWVPIDEAARELVALETKTHEIARTYRVWELDGSLRSFAFVDATESHGEYDKTLLLLLGQKRAPIALVRDRDTVSLAAPFDSGINFLDLLGLSGGMPTLVSIPTSRMAEALTRLGATQDVLERIVPH
jgi:hypothetical protein